MYDVIWLYLDYDPNDRKAQNEVEELLPRVDKLLEENGWEYTNFQNMYRPIKGTDPDDTCYDAEQAIQNAEWLKEYKPYLQIGTLTNVCDLGQIIIQGEEPLDEERLRKYREYYNDSHEYAHEIIVDENNVLMDGYMTYLIAKETKSRPKIICVRRGQRFRKVVIGRYTDDSKRHIWYYDHGPAVVPGDEITVDGEKKMTVEKITYVAGKHDCEQYKTIAAV